MKIFVSIVIPVFNSQNVLRRTVESTIEALVKIDIKFEILLIDDGSSDDSWAVAQSCAEQYSDVKAIQLVRNYGQHTAVFCGITKASGDYIVTMDDDLQNPPEEIEKLLCKIREGYDLVFAKFQSKQHAGYRKLGTKIIDFLNKKIFDKPDDIVLSNFRIFTKEVASRVCKYRGSDPYIPGLLLRSASRISNVVTRHDKREVGESNYNWKRIAKLVARLLFGYSSYPLKFLSTIGVVISLFSFICGVTVIVRQLLIGVEVAGWTTLVVLLSFLNGFIILILGVMGEYVSRLLSTVSTESSYHIGQVIE